MWYHDNVYYKPLNDVYFQLHIFTELDSPFAAIPSLAAECPEHMHEPIAHVVTDTLLRPTRTRAPGAAG